MSKSLKIYLFHASGWKKYQNLNLMSKNIKEKKKRKDLSMRRKIYKKTDFITSTNFHKISQDLLISNVKAIITILSIRWPKY